MYKEEDTRRDNITSLDIGNMGTAVTFRFETDKGELYMHLPTEAARQVVALIEAACDKIESGEYAQDME